MAKRKKNEPLSPSALALTYLRSAAGWTRSQLAHSLGFADESVISAYERGKTLTPERLEEVLAPLGYPREALQVLGFTHSLLFPEPEEEDRSPLALSRAERRIVERAALTAGWSAAQAAAGRVRAGLIHRKEQEKADAARQEAARLLQGLMALTPEERRGLVEAVPDYWSWALAVLLCETSVRKAAHRAGEALELAELALAVADRVPGEEGWRSRLKGYCLGHVANARRVANDLTGADHAFTWAWELWGAGFDSGLLAEWRLFDLEASLRGAERRFPEALNLLDRAKELCEDLSSIGRILLNKEHIFEQMGDIQKALAVLAEAVPFVEASGDARKLLVLRFNMADNLCHLERYSEAAQLLPQVRELAVQQANELDLIRVLWLVAKVAAGQGRTEEAIAGLEQVRQHFTARGLGYDAALSSLDLAALRLKEGHTAEVRELAAAMGWIFEAKGIHREALASLRLFCQAARQEAATVELARGVIAEIEQARRPASPLDEGRGRG